METLIGIKKITMTKANKSAEKRIVWQMEWHFFFTTSQNRGVGGGGRRNLRLSGVVCVFRFPLLATRIVWGL